jgi:5'(3')-deoxyribonucleotidase
VRKIKVVFDFDSTLYNSVEAICTTVISQRYHEIMAGLFPLPISIMIRRWDAQDELPSYTKKDIDEIFENPMFFKLLTPNIDPNGFTMVELLEEMCADEKFDVYICSLGSKRNLELKREFIHQRLPFVKKDNILLLEFDKNHTMTKESIHADIIIDDSAKVIKSARNVTHRILYVHHGEKTEWNQELFDVKEKGLYRADSVGHLNELLGEIVKGIR